MELKAFTEPLSAEERQMRDESRQLAADADAAFDAGYVQAVQEVLDEVCERDPAMAEAIVRKYPEWSRICANRNYGHT